MTKAEARARAREARRALPPGAREAASARIRERVLALPEVRAAGTVAAYVSVRSEVDTRALLRVLVTIGRRVAVPVLVPEGMRLAELRSPDALAPGAHGIPEPVEPRVLVPEADVVLVPGLLFTPEGHRLGNGGGHYDRLLAGMPRALRVALAFEAQVVSALPHEPHDARMDVLVTEARVLRCAR